ncbi:MAG: hypothetical protein AAB304_08210, partial [Pseudomonadota bacterium]
MLPEKQQEGEGSPVNQRSIAILLCVLFGPTVFPAQAGVSHDPALTWHTLHSAHFRIHYYEGEEALAQRTVATAERVHTQLSTVIGWQPEEPVDIVLSDRLDVSNGYA